MSIAESARVKLLSAEPERIPVTCTTCDPPSIKYLLKGTVINEPYICYVCIMRELKRIVRAENAKRGRMGHGEILVSEQIERDAIRGSWNKPTADDSEDD